MKFFMLLSFLVLGQTAFAKYEDVIRGSVTINGEQTYFLGDKGIYSFELGSYSGALIRYAGNYQMLVQGKLVINNGGMEAANGALTIPPTRSLGEFGVSHANLTYFENVERGLSLATAQKPRMLRIP